jgi:hypothetical protein
MKELDIEKLDRYMQRRKIDPAGLKWYDPAAGIFKVEGLYWFDKEKRYNRFPSQLAPGHNEKVVTLARCTAGAQIRFKTDSRRILISVRNTSSSAGVTMAETGSRGFDLYTGTPGKEIFWNTALPIQGDDSYIDEIFYADEKEMREFRLNFPLYNGVQELSIALEENARVLPPAPLAAAAPVVIYGTSITQGGCANRPGMAYTNIISRRLNRPFLNFGFSGSGKGESYVFEQLAKVENPAMFILDYEANAHKEGIFKTLSKGIDIIREKHPETPIMVVSQFHFNREYVATGSVTARAKDAEDTWRFERAEVSRRRRAGDKNITFVYGGWKNEPDWTEFTVDGVHATDLGFYMFAKMLTPKIAKVLDK